MTTRRRPRSRRTEDKHGAWQGHRHSRRVETTGAGRPPKGTHQERTMDYRPSARTASRHGRRRADGGSRMTDLTPAEWSLLLRLQRLALRYFLENQLAGGLVLDRQRNHGPRAASGLCSTAATGMGLIALALAAAPPYRLL